MIISDIKYNIVFTNEKGSKHEEKSSIYLCT
ncbi:hypothetical protein SAMN04487886_10064 [Clostridium sp. DSM 8431]|nr:hypothetical protein SAMN04487886_10064 [Clostridium sp. DSM 8431]